MKISELTSALYYEESRLNAESCHPADCTNSLIWDAYIKDVAKRGAVPPEEATTSPLEINDETRDFWMAAYKIVHVRWEDGIQDIAKYLNYELSE